MRWVYECFSIVKFSVAPSVLLIELKIELTCDRLSATDFLLRGSGRPHPDDCERPEA